MEEGDGAAVGELDIFMPRESSSWPVRAPPFPDADLPAD
jgi:hypothetical protein